MGISWLRPNSRIRLSRVNHSHMKSFQRVYRFGHLGIAVMLMGGTLMGSSLAAIAQGLIQLRLPDISAPGNRESGSTRSTTCVDPKDSVVALVPDTNYGLTQAAYPTFYFYIPPTAAEEVKFVLLNDATNELVYEGRFSIQDRSGIASVSLPNNGLQQPLGINQTYVWYLAVVCDETDPSADIVVEAYVGRITPLPEAEGTQPSELPAFFANQGLWYDAINAAAALKISNGPSAWNTLLDAVALNELIPLPLLTDEPVANETGTNDASIPSINP